MKLSKETLKNMSNEALVEIILLLQNNIEQLNRNVELLTEQIKINNLLLVIQSVLNVESHYFKHYLFSISAVFRKISMDGPGILPRWSGPTLTR